MNIQGYNSNSYNSYNTGTQGQAFNGPLQTNGTSSSMSSLQSELQQMQEELSELDSLLLSDEGQEGSGAGQGASGLAQGSSQVNPFQQFLQELEQALSAEGAGNTGGSNVSSGSGSTGAGSGSTSAGSTGAGNVTGTGGGSTGNSATSPNQGVTLTGGSTAPGTPSDLTHLTNATTYNNLQDSTHFTLHNGNDDIGGSEKNGTITVNPGDAANGNVESYDSTFKGGYADTLASVTTKVSPDATKFLMTSTLDPSAATMKNTQCMENDMVITDKNGNQAQAASQFNLAEKAKPGDCWFQTSKMVSPGKEEWVNAAEVPIPKAGQDNTFQLGVTMGDGGKTYSYSPLEYDGKTYQLQNNTFSTEKSNWTRNECIVQQQEDSNASGGPIDETYSNVSLQVGGASSSFT